MGNTCTDSGRPRGFTLDELADLNVGDRKESQHGCFPAIDGNQGGSAYAWATEKGLTWPKNDEFAWGGMASPCSMCSDILNGYSCDNCSGTSAIGGVRGTVKRVAFKGDKTKCCVQGKRIIDGNTCDPLYSKSYKNDKCDEIMINYCKDNKWDQPECRNWVATTIKNGRTTANIAMNDYCSSELNFPKKECQEWCSATRVRIGMETSCDSALEDYCKDKGASDPNCACMKPPENVSKIQDMIAAPKVCWYKPCKSSITSNYVTYPMQKAECKAVACLIDAGDIKFSGTGNKVEFTNNCGNDLLKPEYKSDNKVPGGGNTVPGGDNTVPGDNTEKKPLIPSIFPLSTTSYIVIAIILCICLMLIFGIGFYAYKSSSSTAPSE